MTPTHLPPPSTVKGVPIRHRGRRKWRGKEERAQEEEDGESDALGNDA